MKDPYLYEGTDVLRNKRGIRNRKEFDDYEYTMAELAMIAIYGMNIDVSSCTSIFQIHRILFEDVYEWAGQKRTINIYKSEPVLDGMSVSYTDFNHIDEDLERIDLEISKIDWSDISDKDKIVKTTRIISDIWRTHAFREGNTRTIYVFLHFFLKHIGLNLDSQVVMDNVKFFRNALVMASIDEYSEYNHLENLLMHSTHIEVPSNLSGSYDTINGYNLKDYEYDYHHIKERGH